MIFDYPFIYHCPKCGKEMQVCNIISGNNVGGTLWSDGKREGPMISASSPVYQCDGCGYYYTLNARAIQALCPFASQKVTPFGLRPRR